ncbi:MAG: DUF58 domain-containing protein [Proteobacteria bacterium]|nr:DUF58 domain-containing protein [Pseudomonadota bacterium]
MIETENELRQRIKHLQLWAAHSISGHQHGSYLSTFAGSGLEFNDFRLYVPGDDVKHIDWKVTARSQDPYVRGFREERDLHLLLLVDISSSMFFGSKKGREKIRICVDFAALLSALTTYHNDKISLALFSDHISHYLPPSRGSAHSFRVLKSILTAPTSSQPTSLKEALHFAMKSLKKRSLVVLLSDFLDSNPYNAEMKALATKHDLTCLRIYDPLEIDPPQGGGWTYRDCESDQRFRGKIGQIITSKLSPSRQLNDYNRAEKTQPFDDWRRTLRNHRTDGYAVDATRDDPIKTLYAMTRKHKASQRL